MLNVDNIPLYASLGASEKNWYRDTNREICNIFPFESPALIIDMLAATSIRASVSSNVTQFFKAYNQHRASRPFVGFLDAVKINLERAVKGQPLTGRKIRNFSEAMKGNPEAVVCDIWICRALGVDRKYIREGYSVPLSGGPTDKIYTAVENYFRQAAREKGLEPRGLCAMVWAGIRIHERAEGIGTRYTNFLLKRTNQLKLDL
jgi:hypothetical protein